MAVVKWTKHTVTVHARELRALRAVALDLHPSSLDQRPGFLWFDLGHHTAWSTNGHLLLVHGCYERASDNVFAVPVAQVPALLRMASSSPSKSVVLGPGVRHGLDLDLPTVDSHVLRWRAGASEWRRQAGAPRAVPRWWMNGEYLRVAGLIERALGGVAANKALVLAPSGPVNVMVVVYPGRKADSDVGNTMAAEEAFAPHGAASTWTVFAMPSRMPLPDQGMVDRRNKLLGAFR